MGPIHQAIKLHSRSYVANRKNNQSTIRAVLMRSGRHSVPHGPSALHARSPAPRKGGRDWHASLGGNLLDQKITGAEKLARQVKLHASQRHHRRLLKMDTLITHPLFGYRVSYRRLLEIQARLLGRVLEGEIGEYPVFLTR